MSLKVLRQKKADLVAEAQKVFDVASAENRGLTEAEKRRDDEIGAALDAVNDDISRAEAQAARQRQLEGLAGGIGQFRDAAEGGQSRSASGFANLGEMLMAVASSSANPSRVDERLQYSAATGLSEGVSADGGFLVENELVADLMTPMWNSGEVMSRVRTIPIGAGKNGIRMNKVDEKSRANGSRWGGFRVYWTGEGNNITASQTKFARMQLELEKVTGMVYATSELLEDSTALSGWMNMALPEEFTFAIEDAVMNGTGTGMPLGYLNSGAAVVVSKEGSQPAATLFAENIVKMWARMPARSRKDAVWLINQDIEPQLLLMNMKIKNVAGTENVGGIAVPPVIYTPPGTASNGYGTLMGRPVVPVEYCSTLGTVGDIQLVDLQQYLMIKKGELKKDSSIHVKFLQDETAFRFTYRMNGMPLWETPITPYKGTNTLSPFVLLQTR